MFLSVDWTQGKKSVIKDMLLTTFQIDKERKINGKKRNRISKIFGIITEVITHKWEYQEKKQQNRIFEVIMAESFPK